MNELAIGILSLRRYQCLSLVLQSLEQNVETDKVDFYLFQDGAVNPYSGVRYASDKEVRLSIEAFRRSGLPNKTIIEQRENIGIGRGVYLEFSELFKRGYKYVTVLPNDILAGKYFIKTLLVLYKQFENEPKLGLLRTLPRVRAEGPEDAVSFGVPIESGTCYDNGLWAGYWEVIRGRMAEYYDIIKDCDYFQFLQCAWQGKFPNLKPKVDLLSSAHFRIVDCEDLPHSFTYQETGRGYRGLYTRTPRMTHLGATSSLWASAAEIARPLDLKRFHLWDFGNVDLYKLQE